MTIKGLNEYVRSKANEASGTILITAFAGKTVAIDGHCLLYAHLKVQGSKVIDRSNIMTEEVPWSEVRHQMIKSILSFCLRWLDYGVKIVLIFDGPSRPEKERTRAQRRALRAKDEVKLAEAKQLLEQQDILFPDQELVKRVKTLMKNVLIPSEEDISSLKHVLKVLGIPCLEAQHDAEELCSTLCLEGRVAAVFSKDGDNLAYGCPLLLTDFEEAVEGVHCLRYIAYQKLLQHMGVTPSQFLDICIMAGCDFNTNIKDISFIRALALIKEFQSIDNLRYDVACLSHHECRRIFGYKESKTVLGEGITELKIEMENRMSDILALSDELNRLRLGDMFSLYRQIMQKWPLTAPQPKTTRIIVKRS